MHRFAFLLSLAAVGCVAATPDDGGDPTGNGPGSWACEPVSELVVGADEVSPAGYSPRAALDAALGEHTAPLAWADGSRSTLTADAALAGDVVFVDFELVVEGDGPVPDLACLDTLEIPVTLVVTSADGAFAETRAVRLAADAGGASAWLDLDGPLSGSFDPGAFVPADRSYDEVSTGMRLRWEAGSLGGAVEGQGSAVEGDVAYAELFEIATIGAPAE